MYASNLANYFSSASAPPMDVVAAQSNSSAPVEVRWSPPSDAAPAIIGYRIFLGNGQNHLLPSYITSIGLNSSQVRSISIRSESTQLPSALITATVTTAGELRSLYIYTKIIDFLDELHRYQ